MSYFWSAGSNLIPVRAHFAGKMTFINWQMIAEMQSTSTFSVDILAVVDVVFPQSSDP